MLPIHALAAIALALPFMYGLAQAQVLTLQEGQVRALDLRSTLAKTEQDAAQRASGRAALPPQAQRVVALPLPGLVEQLRFAPGETVPAGALMAQLRSAQGHELGHDLEGSHQQLASARRTAERDEQLAREGLIAQSRLDASRAALAQAELMYEGRQTALALSGSDGHGLLRARAPMAGLVLEQLVQVGQRVEANQPLYRIARLDQVWIELSLPAPLADQLRPGARIELPGRSGQGVLLGVAGVADPATQLVTLRARYEGASPPRPGQWVEVEIRTAGAQPQRIPASALSERDGRPLVFQDEGQGRYRALRPSSVERRGSEALLQGLPPGVRLVTQGTAALRALLDNAKP